MLFLLHSVRSVEAVPEWKTEIGRLQYLLDYFKEPVQETLFDLRNNSRGVIVHQINHGAFYSIMKVLNRNNTLVNGLTIALKNYITNINSDIYSLHPLAMNFIIHQMMVNLEELKEEIEGVAFHLDQIMEQSQRSINCLIQVRSFCLIAHNDQDAFMFARKVASGDFATSLYTPLHHSIRIINYALESLTIYKEHYQYKIEDYCARHL